MAERDTLFIDGAWVPSSGTDRIEVVDPSTEKVVGTVARGTPEDVDRAVGAARRAFPAWSATPAEERGKHLARIRDGLAARQEEVARLIATEMGAPMRIAMQIQTGLPLTVLASYADLLGDYSFEERIGNSLVVREPIGVVGAITPWNYPLHQAVTKIAAALAAGCTVVLKPSEVAPLGVLAFVAIAAEAGLPAGVLNVVTGYGPEVGEAIAGHDDVDMVSFTGSTRAGSRVAEVAAASVKKVALELGGKSANVVLPSADLATAVKVGVGNAFLNSGQTCTAWTRMLVDRHRYDEAVDLVRAAVEKYVVGPPFEESTRLGPLASSAQRDRVRDYIGKGLAEGARLVAGGAEPPDGLPVGFYVRPTVFADVEPDSTIAREEIFGPVLSLIPYADADEAAQIANASDYGLAGGVWAGDEDEAVAFARRLRTGQVDINGGRFNPLAPFGGYRRSGNGRELGRYGLEEFLEVKSLQL
jgi:aldehyde dehydrogenase (NAD+)